MVGTSTINKINSKYKNLVEFEKAVIIFSKKYHILTIDRDIFTRPGND